MGARLLCVCVCVVAMVGCGGIRAPVAVLPTCSMARTSVAASESRAVDDLDSRRPGLRLAGGGAAEGQGAFFEVWPLSAHTKSCYSFYKNINSVGGRNKAKGTKRAPLRQSQALRPRLSPQCPHAACALLGASIYANAPPTAYTALSTTGALDPAASRL